MTTHDRRLHAIRPDLADASLAGAVTAERFVEGLPARVRAPVVDVLSAPSPAAGLDTQFLRGDDVLVFEERDGFAWVQGSRDGYVGYVSAAALSGEMDPLTHVVAAPRSFLYAEPDMKRPRAGEISLGARVGVTERAETRGTRYARLDTGEWMIERHLAALDGEKPDFVAMAEMLLRTPYLWGGASAHGIDCSGLVQLSLRMAGRSVLRDTDMQEATLGEPVNPGENFRELRRGDLVFWRGHVGIMAGAETLIHANGHTMDVALEPLAEAVGRIGYLYGGPTAFRRI
ncbi:MAG TPA: NlpC/P60 family protein [Mesorhizobium sp.]|jgi:cell wall-associated NlpC family hydrolase|nr:NlpC/P60 family protein [Mesorhizobium sp.]